MNLSSIEGNPVQFADWAELEILYSGVTGISLESIRTEADVEGLLAAHESSGVVGLPEASEHLVAELVREVERRVAYGGRGYPFRIRENRIEIRPGTHRLTPYIFCLMVSDRDYWTPNDPSPLMFEHLASIALQAYLEGNSLRFGAPRDAPEHPIEVALCQLAKRTGDMLLSVYPVKSTDKDLGLDVVGWRDFADKQTSKLLVYMQCATGRDWPNKRGDLDLSTGGVWNRTISWTTPPVKALAIPYVVQPGVEWGRATPGLLLMDRLRISSVLPAKAVSVAGIDWRGWFNNRIASVSQFRN